VRFTPDGPEQTLVELEHRLLHRLVRQPQSVMVSGVS
jgi:hypothetical protein